MHTPPQVRAFSQDVSEQHGGGDQVGVHGGWHVRHQGPEEGGHGEGLPGRGEEGHPGIRQVLIHAHLHDLQLESVLKLVCKIYFCVKI